MVAQEYAGTHHLRSTGHDTGPPLHLL